MESEIIKIEFSNKVITLSYVPFDTDVDLDDITFIHYENLYGEMTTSSALMNRIGILQAEVEAAVKEHNLELAIYKADLFERFRKDLTRVEGYVRKEGTKKIEPGNTELENAVFLDKGYQNKYKENVRLQKNLAYISSLYWAVKSKDTKLSVLLKGVTPEEFQNGIIEGVVNTIMISSRKSVLPSMPNYK